MIRSSAGLLALLVVTWLLPPLQSQNMPVIEAEEIIQLLETGQPVTLDGYQIEGDLDLAKLNLAVETPSQVSVPIAIENSVFLGKVTFTDLVSARLLSFTERVSFANTTFSQDAIFSGVTFINQAEFSDAVFLAFAHFESVKFDNAVFIGSEFREQSIFARAVFEDETEFISTKFYGDAIFVDIRFVGEANFSFARFEGHAAFIESKFEHSVTFEDAVFLGGADFTNTIFVEGAEFTDSQFHQDAFFNQGEFEKETIFNRTIFTGTANFRGANFTTVDFVDASFQDEQWILVGTDYSMLKLQVFDIAWLGFPQPDDSTSEQIKTLIKLEGSLREQDRLSQANKLLYERKVLERGRNESAFVRLLELVFLDVPFGYGVRPIQALLSSAIVIIVFAAVYFRYTNFRVDPDAKPAEKHFGLVPKIRVDPIELSRMGKRAGVSRWLRKKFPSLKNISWIDDLAEGLLFSIAVFTRVGLAKYIVTGRSRVVYVESLLGIYLIAGFIYSLSQTTPLIKSLVDAIF